MTKRLAVWLYPRLILRVVCQRLPDFVVGTSDSPYLLRWWLLGGKPAPQLPGGEMSKSFLGFRPYLHCFKRSDDDRAHHDHPSASLSLMLAGEAIEHTIDAGGIHQRRQLRAGSVRFRTAKFAHRIEIAPGADCWTLFIFLPGRREWGFHCPEKGWVHWRLFTAPGNAGEIGRGCGE